MLATTTIGSFPLSPRNENFRKALIDQINARITYPALPQLEDFCLLYLREFERDKCGIEIINETPWITGSIKTPIIRNIINQIYEAINLLKEHNKEGMLKVQVTGPLTLASVTKVTDKMIALSYESIVEEFIEAITGIVNQIASINDVKIIFIDEPSLSYASWMGINEEILIKAISKPLNKANSKGKITGVHVCGDIRGLSNILLQTSAKILHHEFKGFPQNLKAYSKKDLEANDKILGLGCVQTVPKDSEIVIESIGEVVNFIKNAGEKFGFEKIFLAPDCGFKGFRQIFNSEDEAQKIVKIKMRTMTEAAELIRTTLL